MARAETPGAPVTVAAVRDALPPANRLVYQAS